LITAILVYSTAFLLSLFFTNFYERVKKTSFIKKSFLSQHYLISRKFDLFILFVLSLIPLVFIGAIRVGIGKDYSDYLSSYIYYQAQPFFDSIFHSNEPGMVFLYKISGYIFLGSDFGFFALSVFVTVLFVFLSLRYYCNNLSMSFGLYIFLMLFFIESFNLVAQMISVSIVLFAYKYIIEKKPIKYVLFIALATAFHLSAAITIIYLFFIFYSSKKKYVVLEHIFDYLYIILIVLSPLYIGILFDVAEKIPLFSSYFQGAVINFNGYGIGFMIDILPILLIMTVFFVYRKKINLGSNIKILIYILLTSFPLRLFAYYYYWGYRLFYYPAFLEIIIIPYIIGSIQKKRSRQIITLCFILIYLFYFIYNYLICNSGPAYPWKSIL